MKEKTGYTVALPRGKNKKGDKLFLVSDVEDLTIDEFIEWMMHVYPLGNIKELTKSNLNDKVARMRLVELIAAASEQNIFVISKK